MRKLADKTDDEILSGISAIRGVEIRDTADLLLYIDEVRHRRLHLLRGSRSIYKFLAEQHGYSKNQAYLRTRAAEALALEPTVEAAVRENRVCITSLMAAVVAIRRESKRLRTLRLPGVTLPEKRALLVDVIGAEDPRRVIASHFPELSELVSSERAVSGALTEYKMFATSLEVARINRVKEHLSAKHIDGDWHDIVMSMVEIVLRKFESGAVRAPSEATSMKQRSYVSVDIERALRARSGGQCEWVCLNTGRRCDSRRDLQRDHVLPIAHGGTDSFDNFRLLCGAHNRYAAWLMGL